MRSTIAEIGTTLDFFSVAAFSSADVVWLALHNPRGRLPIDGSGDPLIGKPVPLAMEGVPPTQIVRYGFTFLLALD